MFNSLFVYDVIILLNSILYFILELKMKLSNAMNE